MLGLIVNAVFALQFLIAQPLWAQTCQNLFQPQEIHTTKFKLTEEQVAIPPLVNVAPLESTTAVNKAFKKLLQSSNLKFLPAGSRFAIHLSHQNQIHLVSEGLTSQQHLQLLTFLQVNRAEQILLGVPTLFRNRYFEVEILAHETQSTTVEVTPKLAWDLKVSLDSQVISGFASAPTGKIRPYNSTITNPDEKIRRDLLNPRFTQDTFATCGLASVIKVFKRRKINYSERELLGFIENSGIKKIRQIFGSEPGLSLSQAAKFLEILGRQHGFTVTEVKVTSDEGVAEFARMAERAAQGKNIDVIVNYYSPVVGRPGGGHFTPIAGYNPKTKDVLLGEVNLAMNPPFWTNEKTLVEAMSAQSSTEPVRGYLVIHWLNILK